MNKTFNCSICTFFLLTSRFSQVYSFMHIDLQVGLEYIDVGLVIQICIPAPNMCK